MKFRMNKRLSACIAALSCATLIFAQSNSSVAISNEVYGVIEAAQLRGLCAPLPGARPWTERRILSAIDEVLESRTMLHPAEVQVLEDFASSCGRKSGKDALGMRFRVDGNDGGVPVSLDVRFGQEASASGGLYSKPQFDQWGFDAISSLYISGDVGKFLSYKVAAFADITRMPLYECGDDYFIGYTWFDEGVEEFLDGKKKPDGSEYNPNRRTVKKLINTSYLPYQYQRRWDGQMRLLSNLSANGMEGWPQTTGWSGNVNPEVRASFMDGRISFGAGRVYREWAAMDFGSSLVLNSAARPFFAGDVTVELFPFLKFSSLSGILEYPNQDYMNGNSYPSEKKGWIDDSVLYQNAFSMNMLELDFPYLHLDFGGTVVYPKRFEIGYLMPLAMYLDYQNHIGDCDNLSLFGNIKLKKPGAGAIWASLYVDEINGLNNDPFTSSRAMFAGQFGTKMVIPWLPSGSLSMRYTKIEPYCYTHHSINYTPWYDNYISENYTSGGESLGYYLPPNSDEFLIRIEARPVAALAASFQYQFVRHGADYGSQQVPGSSLYSELSPYNRDSLKKYFLCDGAYQWMHSASASVIYNFRRTAIPLQISGTAGFLYSYYTMIDDDVYKPRSDYGNNGNSAADRYTPFYPVDSDEYPVQMGAVLSVGLKMWFW